MLNKIIWTKTSQFKDYNQFEFELPCGYRVFNSEDIVITNTSPTKIDLGIKIYSEEPITLIYTKSILSNDFLIIDPIQIIIPKCSCNLFLNVINPFYEKDYDHWELKKGSLIATMIPVNTSFTNLLEVNNQVFTQYE